MTVAIVGLGLIGGSCAKALKAKTRHRVLGWDRDPAVRKAALTCRAIDDVTERFDEADITLVALYPHDAVMFLKQYSKRFKAGSTVVDLCGVKRYVCGSLKKTFANDVVFIGGHPLADRGCRGFQNAVAGLFEGAGMILVPDEEILLERLTPVCDFFRALGFERVEVTHAERHDEMIAYTSQLAHILSSAYVKTPIARDCDGFTADIFGDMTRGACLNEALWTELFLRNADYLAPQLDLLIESLTEFRGAIDAGDAAALERLLRDGREKCETLNQV